MRRFLLAVLVVLAGCHPYPYNYPFQQQLASAAPRHIRLVGVPNEQLIQGEVGRDTTILFNVWDMPADWENWHPDLCYKWTTSDSTVAAIGYTGCDQLNAGVWFVKPGEARVTMTATDKKSKKLYAYGEILVRIQAHK